MKSRFRTIVAVIGVIFGMAASLPPAVAQSTEETPIITFKTNIYEQYGAENAFHIVLGTTKTDYFDVDCGFGSAEYEVSSAYFDNESQAMVGTTIACRVSPEGIVRIYGDPVKIDYIDAEGCYIDWIDMDKCLNLEILNLSHNELKRLDLSPFARLQALYLSDNPFTAESPLKIGPDKPDLTILEIDIIEHLDQSFNLSDYPSLISFDAYHNIDLYNVDPTGCPQLAVMSLELTNVSTLDVSKNQKLYRLNISDTRIQNIDISRNTELENLLAQHTSGSINTDIHLTSIDVSKNPKLRLLNLVGNKIADIDLSNNPLLTNLNMRRNCLSSIDLSNNPNLYAVDLAYNDFDFVTLPLPQKGWGEYYYQRSPMACEKSYPIGSEIDFSNRVLRDGYETFARVMLDTPDAEPVELDESYYTFADGKITFNAIPSDSVYVEFACNAFTDYTISSDLFKVKDPSDIGQPNKTLSFKTTSAMAGKEIAFKVGVDGASAESPRDFFVDVNGERTTFSAAASDFTANSNVTFTLPATGTATVDIFMPEGEHLTAFGINDVTMSSIDITQARELRNLSISGCNLLRIDASYNRNLRSLDLSHNRLTSFSFAGVYGDYEKNLLTDIDLSHNYITSLTFVNTTHIRRMNLADNRLTEMLLKNFDNLTDIDLSNNRLSGDFSLTYQEQAVNIDLSGNFISSLTTVDMPDLQNFNISDNNLTLQTLPLMPQVANYTYAPQKELQIIAFAPAINLTAQNRVIDGASTVFTWKKTDGTPLAENVDFSGKDGAFKFIDETLGQVYCEMTHAAFPAFNGENVFRTSATTVTGAPTTLVATFITSENSDAGQVVFTGHKDTALYIDWRGDGTEYIQYPVADESYTQYTGQTTYADANVKVYTYESPDDISVFSISDISMTHMDASALTKLIAFTVDGAGLDEQSLVLPAASDLRELNLGGNHFSSADFSQIFPNLTTLALGNNAYDSFDASGYHSLGSLYISNNNLASLTFGDNKMLWELMADGNELQEISFDGCPVMSQVNLSRNKLKTLDLTPIKNTIRVLDIGLNEFTFATLPVQSDYPYLNVYNYGGQANLVAECVNGQVDLSSQAMVNDTPTTYRWYLGDVEYDSTTGEYSGEALYSDVDDPDNPEFMVEDGVTSFFTTFSNHLTGLMTNELFPKLTLFTTPVIVDKAGIENVTTDRVAPDTPVDVYTLSGVRICSRTTVESLGTLSPGLYILKIKGQPAHKHIVR